MNCLNDIGFRYVILYFALSLSVSGCASFINKDFPNYTNEQFQPMPNKPSIDFDIKSLVVEGSQYQGATREKSFEEYINKSFAQNNCFSKFSSGIGTADYHFSFSFDIRQHFSMSLLILYVITGTILPAYIEEDYTLNVDVSKGDQFLKQYEYKDYVTVWLDLFLVVLTPSHFPVDADRQVMNQMFMAFLHDFRKDVALEHTRQP